MKLDHPLVRESEMTCSGCPVQIEGTLTDGRHFYFRYRFGHATLGIGPDPDSAVRDTLRHIPYGDELQGILSDDEVRKLFRDLIAPSRSDASASEPSESCS